MRRQRRLLLAVAILQQPWFIWHGAVCLPPVRPLYAYGIVYPNQMTGQTFCYATINLGRRSVAHGNPHGRR
jgi:hypothetical protein